MNNPNVIFKENPSLEMFELVPLINEVLDLIVGVIPSNSQIEIVGGEYFASAMFWKESDLDHEFSNYSVEGEFEESTGPNKTLFTISNIGSIFLRSPRTEVASPTHFSDVLNDLAEKLNYEESLNPLEYDTLKKIAGRLEN